MEIDPEGSKYLKLLNIFTYGRYKDYTLQAAQLPLLSPPMSKKLRQLTIVSLAAETKVRVLFKLSSLFVKLLYYE